MWKNHENGLISSDKFNLTEKIIFLEEKGLQHEMLEVMVLCTRQQGRQNHPANGATHSGAFEAK